MYVIIPRSEELKSNYYKAKQDGKLKLVKLLVGGDFYIRNSDFLGNKYLSPGTILEAEVYDNVICQVWLSPTECEFVFINELEYPNRLYEKFLGIPLQNCIVRQSAM